MGVHQQQVTGSSLHVLKKSHNYKRWVFDSKEASLLLQAHCSDFLSSNAHEQLLNKCLDDIKFKEKKWWPSPSPESSQIWSLYKVVLNWKTNKFNFSETTQVLTSLYTDSLVVLKLTCDVRVSHKTTREDNEPYTTGCGMIWSAEGSEKLWMK